MILAVVGAGAAAASTVLSALESDWLNTATNNDSTHPCKNAAIESYPTELICISFECTIEYFNSNN